MLVRAAVLTRKHLDGKQQCFQVPQRLRVAVKELDGLPTLIIMAIVIVIDLPYHTPYLVQ